MRLKMWPEDEFEMDFSGFTGNEYQAGVAPLQTTLYEPWGDPFGSSSGMDVSGGQMTILDFTNTYPDTPSVIPSNNIQGQMPGFLNQISGLLTSFGGAYAKVAAANVQPTANRIVPNGARPFSPYQPPTSPDFITQHKNILIPAGLAALLYLLA